MIEVDWHLGQQPLLFNKIMQCVNLLFIEIIDLKWLIHQVNYDFLIDMMLIVAYV